MKKILTTITVLTLAVVLGQGLITSVQAYRGDATKTGPNCTKERHEAMEKALETKNYAEWKKLMENRPIVNRITEANFSKFAQVHQLMEEGKVEEANKIRAELNLGQGLKNGQGEGQKTGNGYGRNL